MQLFTFDMIITAAGTYFEVARKVTAALFAAAYQNIGLSFNDLLHSDHKLASAFILVGTIIFLVRLARARKLGFIQSIFSG